MEAERRLPIIVALGLTLVTAVNVLMLVRTPSSSRPIHFHDQGGLAYLVEAGRETERKYYGIYFDLREVAADRRVIAYSGSPLDPYAALGLAGVEVAVQQYDPRLSEGEARMLLDRPHVAGDLWRRSERTDEPYVIVASSSGAGPWRAMEHTGTLFLVEEGVLADLGIDWRQAA
ncbi:MAG: hypothetical protein ACRDVM_01195 [Acidimicrobiia bacterium]